MTLEAISASAATSARATQSAFASLVRQRISARATRFSASRERQRRHGTNQRISSKPPVATTRITTVVAQTAAMWRQPSAPIALDRGAEPERADGDQEPGRSRPATSAFLTWS